MLYDCLAVPNVWCRPHVKRMDTVSNLEANRFECRDLSCHKRGHLPLNRIDLVEYHSEQVGLLRRVGVAREWKDDMKDGFCWLFWSREEVILCIMMSRSVLKRIINVVMVLKVVLVVVGKQVTTGCWSSTRASLTLLLPELLTCTGSCIGSWTVRSVSTTAWSYMASWCLMWLVHLMVWSEGPSSATSTSAQVEPW